MDWPSRDTETLQDMIRQGVSLLGAGDLSAAQTHIRRALAIRPANPQAQNLMAVTFFYDGAKELACDIFDGLARRHADVTVLRINAGLAALTCGRVERALIHLQRAVAVDPDNQRAFAYLAILHAEQEDIVLTRAALLEARLNDLANELNNTEMPSGFRGRIEQAIVGQLVAQEIGNDDFWEVQWDTPDDEKKRRRSHASAAVRRLSKSARSDDLPSNNEQVVQETPEHDWDIQGTVSVANKKDLLSRGQRRFSETAKGSSGKRLTNNAAPEPPFFIRDGWLEIRVSSVAREEFVPHAAVRQDTIVGLQGHVALDVMNRRKRGLAIDAFGIGEMRFFRASGDGIVMLQPHQESQITLLTLSTAASNVLLLERSMVAFSSRLQWENGRLPRGDDAVRLVGRGTAALMHKGPLRRIPVSKGGPAAVSSRAFLGCIGDVSACLVADKKTGDGNSYYLCEGQGIALVSGVGVSYVTCD